MAEGVVRRILKKVNKLPRSEIRYSRKIGSAVIQTFIRVRERIYSNLLGLQVFSSAGSVGERLQGCANEVFAHSISAGAA